TAGPGTVKGTYEVDLPRPRNIAEIRFQPRFPQIYEAIWSQLRDEVLVSYERQKHGAAVYRVRAWRRPAVLQRGYPPPGWGTARPTGCHAGDGGNQARHS